MSTQDLLFGASSLSFASCGVLLAMAAHTYVSENMRAVFDDLSGKRRSRDIEQAFLAAHGGADARLPQATQAQTQARARARRKGAVRGGAFRGGASTPSGAAGGGSGEATVIAFDRDIREADKTLVAGGVRFSLVSKTVLCGTAEVVEGGGE